MNVYAYVGPDELADVIDYALTQVVDPELALNIVDIGLVQSVVVEGDIVDVKVTMTSAACPVTDTIIADIEDRLDECLPASWRIRVELQWEPPWTPDRMSEQARKFMGW
jgi:metal-sulfur cluster biosynthetic enzyme